MHLLAIWHLDLIYLMQFHGDYLLNNAIPKYSNIQI